MTSQRKAAAAALLLLLLGLIQQAGISQEKEKVEEIPPVQAKFEILDRQGAVTTSLTDGDWIKLRVSLDQEAGLALAVGFMIDKVGTKEVAKDAAVAARCIIPQGTDRCETELMPALGWYWNKEGKAEPEREVRAATTDPGLPKQLQFSTTLKVTLKPRPVVMVHGLASNAKTWGSYTMIGGYLASTGLPGYAVGDGKAEGVMSTGDPAQPLKPTNTIAQNAEILGQYIAGVKKASGAQTIDLLAHSMGGLIARYYIDRVMKDRDVAQLIMLGTPNAGSDCACLPSALGFYMPASLELRPGYINGVFNKQITQRKGIPFTMLAGTQIVDAFKAPCTDTPSDLVVATASVKAITGALVEKPFLHTDMTGSETVFKDYVLPLLKKQAGQFPVAIDPSLPAVTASPAQYTRYFSGHVDRGRSQEMTVNLDQVAIAGFALFDPTRSLKVTVRGASGNVIALDPAANGMIEVNDPSSMITLGYGFDKPSPGVWKVTLDTTGKTPAAGADFALSARVVGGAVLRAQTDKLLPQAGQTVTVSGTLELAQSPLADAVLEGIVRAPNGAKTDLKFEKKDNESRAVWTTAEPGVYAIDILAHGTAPNGMPIERASFLSVEVQPDPNRGILPIALGVGALLTVVTLIGFWLKNRFLGNRKRGGIEL